MRYRFLPAVLLLALAPAAPAEEIVVKAAKVYTLTGPPLAPGNGNNSRNRPDSIYNRQPTNRMGVVWILRQEFGRAKLLGTRDGDVLGDVLARKRPVVCVSRADVDISAALRLRQEYPMAMTIAGGHEAYKLRAELAAAKVP